MSSLCPISEWNVMMIVSDLDKDSDADSGNDDNEDGDSVSGPTEVRFAPQQTASCKLWIANLSLNQENVRYTGVCVISSGRYIEVLLYLKIHAANNSQYFKMFMD